jgi:hypothetical protein
MRILLLLAIAAIGWADNTVHYVLVAGQSLADGVGGSPCLSQMQPPLGATSWVDHSAGTTFPRYNFGYVSSAAADFAGTCRAGAYRTIVGTVAIDTSGNVTGTGTSFLTQHNNGALIAAGQEFIFTYASSTTGTVTPHPGVAIPAGTSFSLSATGNGGGMNQSFERHWYALINQMTQLHPTKDWVGAVISAAASGQSYSVLKKNGSGAQYATSITALTTEAAYLAATHAPSGRPRARKVVAMSVVHGEADLEGGAAPVYVANLREWRTDYLTDAKAATGQTDNFVMFTDQYSSWARVRTTPTVNRLSSDPSLPSSTYPVGHVIWNTTSGTYKKNVAGSWVTDTTTCAGYLSGLCPSTPIAQWWAARDYPNEIKLVGPKYQYKYSDGLHLNAYSYRLLGEMFGKAIAKELHSGQKWVPLSPRSITRTGATITAQFWVPVGCLAEDNSRNDAAVQQFAKNYYGFEYFDSTASASISSATISSCDTVTITLSGTPSGSNQRLRYAYTGTLAANGGTSGAARGTLADDDPAVGLDGLSLRDYAISFDEPVGFSWDPALVGLSNRRRFLGGLLF